MTTDDREHRPVTQRVQSRCRVDCACGWRGQVVSTWAEGHDRWVEHWVAEKPSLFDADMDLPPRVWRRQVPVADRQRLLS